MKEVYLGHGYISGLGFRLPGDRPETILEDTEFSKSMQLLEEEDLDLDLDEDSEFYVDEFGIKRKRKVMHGRELQDIDVEEISL